MRRDSNLRPEAAEAAAQAAGGRCDDAEVVAPEEEGRQTTDAQIGNQLRPKGNSKDQTGLIGFGERDNRKDA